MRLQQQQLLIKAQLDRAYDDRLGDASCRFELVCIAAPGMFSCDAVGCHPLAPAEDGRPRLRQDQLLSLWKFYNDGGAITPKLDATLMLFNTTQLLYRLLVTSNQFKRWLKQNGCTFTPGHGGHLIVRRGDRTSVLPMHGSGKELGTGLVQKIKKDLGLR